MEVPIEEPQTAIHSAWRAFIPLQPQIRGRYLFFSSTVEMNCRGDLLGLLNNVVESSESIHSKDMPPKSAYSRNRKKLAFLGIL